MVISYVNISVDVNVDMWWLLCRCIFVFFGFVRY